MALQYQHRPLSLIYIYIYIYYTPRPQILILGSILNNMTAVHKSHLLTSAFTPFPLFLYPFHNRASIIAFSVKAVNYVARTSLSFIWPSFGCSCYMCKHLKLTTTRQLQHAYTHKTHSHTPHHTHTRCENNEKPHRSLHKRFYYQLPQLYPGFLSSRAYYWVRHRGC
jgi:hypothetical protein